MQVCRKVPVQSERSGNRQLIASLTLSPHWSMYRTLSLKLQSNHWIWHQMKRQCPLQHQKQGPISREARPKAPSQLRKRNLAIVLRAQLREFLAQCSDSNNLGAELMWRRKGKGREAKIASRNNRLSLKRIKSVAVANMSQAVAKVFGTTQALVLKPGLTWVGIT